MVLRRADLYRSHLSSLVLFICLGVSTRPAIPQSPSKGSSIDNSQSAQNFAFDLISIRPHKPGTPLIGRVYSQDGYRVSLTAETIIKIAYIPIQTTSQLSHAPDWVFQDIYDIDARVAPEDMASWLKADVDEDSELLHIALRKALKERFHLELHIAPIEIPYLNIVMKDHKRIPKDSVPGAIKQVPDKTTAAGNGFYVQQKGKRLFAGVSMDDLGKVLFRMSRDQPIQDKTGLTGRYDFTLPYYDSSQLPDAELSTPFDRMPIDSIGLKLVQGKGPSFDIAIDHIERPTPN